MKKENSKITMLLEDWENLISKIVDMPYEELIDTQNHLIFDRVDGKMKVERINGHIDPVIDSLCGVRKIYLSLAKMIAPSPTSRKELSKIFFKNPDKFFNEVVEVIVSDL